MTALYVALGVLGAIFLVVYLTSLFETLWLPKNVQIAVAPSMGLGLPEGSIRGLIAFLLIGAFIIFVFFGRGAVSTTSKEVLRDKTGEVIQVSAADRTPVTVEKTDTSLYVTVLTAFATLTSAISSFYFGSRASAPPATPAVRPATPPTPTGVRPATPAPPAPPTPPGVKPSAPLQG